MCTFNSVCNISMDQMSIVFAVLSLQSQFQFIFFTVKPPKWLTLQAPKYLSHFLSSQFENQFKL